MPAERRLYNRLGVPPNASPEDIKRAYKRLALKHHPDRGGDAKAFQDLSSAYEVLSDQDRRAQYDQLGDEGYEQAQQIQPRARTGTDQAVFDLFRSFFADRGGFDSLFGARHSAMPVKASIPVTLQDVFMGSIKKVGIKRTSPCDSCVAGESPGPACRTCEGSGVRIRRLGGPGFLQVQMACQDCQGRGWLSRARCKLCHGCGQREEHEVARVDRSFGCRLNLGWTMDPSFPATRLMAGSAETCWESSRCSRTHTSYVVEMTCTLFCRFLWLMP